METPESGEDLKKRQLNGYGGPGQVRNPAEARLRPKKRDRVAKERALLAAAERLFAQRGYEASSTREIAAEAGCAEGLIHRYFQGKAGLLQGLVRARMLQAKGPSMRRLPAAANVEDEFLQLVACQVEQVWQARDFLKILVPESLRDPSWRGALASIVIAGHDPSILERLKSFNKGRLAGKEQLTMLAHLIDVLGFYFGFLQPVALGHNHELAKRTSTVLARILIRSANSIGEDRDFLSDQCNQLIFS